jgi:pimeloyl-ACP methyl ester carboxylesterase
MPDVRKRDLNVLDIRSRVLETGPPGADEAVVFLHGAPGSADVWADLQPRVGAFARAVAFDLPGYGAAGRPRDRDYSARMYADAIGAAITALGIRRAHLVMNDIGGFGLIWAAAHPEAFASAVLIDTGIINQMRHWHPVGRLFRTPFLGGLAERLGHVGIGAILRHYDVLPPEIIRRWRTGFDRGQRRALHRMYRATPTTFGQPLIPVLREMDRPGLVIWGRHDQFMPVTEAPSQRRAFPSAHLEILDASGHYPHLDDPHRTAAHVLPFLRTHIGATTPR